MVGLVTDWLGARDTRWTWAAGEQVVVQFLEMGSSAVVLGLEER